MSDLQSLAPVATADTPRLKRSLGLGMVILFGLGVTIGAGIYVLIGAAAARAGAQAPLAFLLAALVMAPTAASFAEFTTRLPRSGGEAVFVKAGFRSNRLAVLVGLLVAGIGIVSAAAIARGSAGYIRTFIELPAALVSLVVVLAMGAVAAKGIRESVGLAAVMTIIELVGLLTIIVAGAGKFGPSLAGEAPAITGASDPAISAGIISATLLAVFAFIGFESLSNIAEEVRAPERTLPVAIFVTLILATLLYTLVAMTALAAVPRAELAAAEAPLSLVFQRITGASPALISAIATVAVTNGVIVQMVMASRVLYGLADEGLLPSALAHISPTARTPTTATGLVVVIVATLAVAAPLTRLAEVTSLLTLVVFAFVNAALVLLKRRDRGTPSNGFRVPLLVPALGCVLCLLLLASAILA
jgi:amino acid transporter